MDAKLPLLLSLTARVAADLDAMPGALTSEAARRMLFDLLPQALVLLGRSASVANEVTATQTSPSGRAVGSALKTKTILAALRKDVAKLHERINAGIHSLQRAEGGPGEEGTRVLDGLLLIDDRLDRISQDLDDARDTLGRMGGDVYDAEASAEIGVTAEREVELDGGGPRATEREPASRMKATADATPREQTGGRGGFASSGGFARKGAEAGKARPTAAETFRKRDDKKKRLEDKRVLRETFEGVGQGRVGAQMAEDATPVVDEIFALALRFKDGSLPWAAKILGVPVTADLERARKQFRQRARDFHPDATTHPRATEAFHLLQRAWDAFEAHTKGMTP